MAKKPPQQPPVLVNDPRTPTGRMEAHRARMGLDGNGNIPDGADPLTIARLKGADPKAVADAKRAMRELVVKPGQMWRDPRTGERLIVTAHEAATDTTPEHFRASTVDAHGEIQPESKRTLSAFIGLELVVDNVADLAGNPEPVDLGRAHARDLLYATLLLDQASTLAKQLSAALIMSGDQAVAQAIYAAGSLAGTARHLDQLASRVAVSVGSHLRGAIPESDRIILAEIAQAGPDGIAQAAMVETLGPVLGTRQPVDAFLGRVALYAALGYVRVDGSTGEPRLLSSKEV